MLVSRYVGMSVSRYGCCRVIVVAGVFFVGVIVVNDSSPPSSFFLLLLFSLFPSLPPFSSPLSPFFIIRLHYHEKKANQGSLIMVVEAIKIYNCLFYVGTQ
jgi:hypothetical protein